MKPMHKAELLKRLTTFLDRRVPHKGISSNDQLKADQIAAYIAILLSYASAGDAWWQRFTKDLGTRNPTWGWPTEAEVRLSAQEASKEQADKNLAWKPDSLEIAIGRLEKDEPIGESWLWGRNAVKLIARVGMDPVSQRRDQVARDFARAYDIERARAMITERQITHEKAVQETKNERQPRKSVEAKLIIKSVRDLLGPGPEYVPYIDAEAE